MSDNKQYQTLTMVTKMSKTSTKKTKLRLGLRFAAENRERISSLGIYLLRVSYLSL